MIDSTLGTIYEDVANLQERVTALETQMTSVQAGMGDLSSDILGLEDDITALNPQILAENVDLNNLGVGSYIIPSASVCATLLNKPISNNATGFIKVVSGGSAGQLMMYYFPCAKAGASYYQRAYYESAWGNWNDIDVFNSGWLDLTLNSGVNAFNEEQKPRYRRVGKEVFITGVIKNISANETAIATLPVNYRPSKKIIIAVPSTGERFSRISILTSGVITYEQIDNSTPVASYWHSLACNFNVD